MFGFLKKIKNALVKTRSFLGAKVRALFGQPWDEATLEKLEETLYEADLGISCAADFTEHVRRFLCKSPDADSEAILGALQKHALEILQGPPKVKTAVGSPLVFLIVGVNGSGKTTSIAKLARLFQEQGKSVLLAAADTFRAAAIDQLSLWAERLKVDIVKSKTGSDASSVAFDAIQAAKARGVDVVLIDTAGRLQNKVDLMRELEKVRRVCQKVIPEAPHETILVLDATVGQNAIDQAKTFHEFTPLTGILLAKLDGSAKGGIVLAIYKEIGIPIRFVGVGEGADDLLPFDAEEYVAGLFEGD